MRPALLLALLGACALDLPPRHIIVTGDPADMSPELIEGADAWLQLGFDASFTGSGLPACAPVMAPEVVDCEVTLVVQRVANLERDYKADGLSSGTLIQIDAKWSGFAVVALMAHETGHAILGWRHTAPGLDAIMAPAGAEWQAQPADYALACEETGLGCDAGPLIR